MPSRIVIDTNVFISAIIGPQGPSRKLLRSCFEDKLVPLMGNALFCEYQEVVDRPKVLELCPLSQKEIRELISSFMSICEWTSIYYLWRPNLNDEGDNHLIELAVAGNAEIIATNNRKDFKNMDLVFPNLKILKPEQILKEL